MCQGIVIFNEGTRLNDVMIGDSIACLFIVKLVVYTAKFYISENFVFPGTRHSEEKVFVRNLFPPGDIVYLGPILRR